LKTITEQNKMKKIDHPLFGKIGAFWIKGVPTPFYSLSEATVYQKENGGDILDSQGKVLYPEPVVPQVEQVVNEMIADTSGSSASTNIEEKKSGGWFSRLLGR
jgi:hypothetical protein